MLLIGITSVIAIVSFIVYKISERNWRSNISDWMIPIVILSIVAMATMLLTLPAIRYDSKCDAIKLQEMKDTITYEIESGVCKDEFGLLNKSVLDDIRDYNKEVRVAKKIRDNIWVGAYVSSVYDDMEYIDYDIVSR